MTTEKVLALLVARPNQARSYLREASAETRRSVLRQLLAHVEVHLAQGHRGAARTLLLLGDAVAQDDADLAYRLERKWIGWLEKEGLRDDAILRLERLFERYRRGRGYAQRAAELAMELGILLDRSGRKEEALRRFRGAAARYRNLGHSYNRAAALFNTASMLYDIAQASEKSDRKRALDRYRRSIDACRRALQEGGSGHDDLEAHISLQLANSHESTEERYEAEEYYRLAADGYRRLGNRRQESDILYRLGWMKRKRGRHDQAEPLLNRALQLKRESDYGTGLARYHLHRAESYRTVGLEDHARHHYRACLSLAAPLGLDPLCKRARFGLFLLNDRRKHSLSSHLKLPPPPGGETSIARGRGGVYCEQAGDGCGTAPWRQSGGTDSPPGDRLFLARLLRELSHAWAETGVSGHENLRRQERAVWSWHSRQGQL